MKTNLWIITVAMSLAWVNGHSQTPERLAAFGIYLMENPIDPRLAGYGVGDWENVPLLDAPILSLDDIHNYDWTHHRIALNPSVRARLPRPPVHGLGFVVVVNGERIYPGLFTTILSSFSFALPNIRVDEHDKPEDNVTITRAYPTSDFSVEPDRRSDERIRKALAEAGKLNRPPADDPAGALGEMGQPPYSAHEITADKVIRFVQPGDGLAFVQFTDLEGPFMNYRARFTRAHGTEMEHRGAVGKRAEDGWQTPVLVKAGDISFECSEGGPDNSYLYFDPRTRKATVVEEGPSQNDE